MHSVELSETFVEARSQAILTRLAQIELFVPTARVIILWHISQWDGKGGEGGTPWLPATVSCD
jgi:hypothetical protein